MDSKKKAALQADVEKALTVPDNLQDYLKGKYPESFEGWDGYEFSIRARMRKSEQPEMLAMILNASDSEYTKVSLHAAFHMSEDSDGNEVIRVGMHELLKEFVDTYIHGVTI
jgi:hypothetical protein